MLQRAAVARVVALHHVGAPAEGAEGQAAAEVLAQRGHVGPDAEQRLAAAEGQARGHHLVEDQQRAALVGQHAQAVQKIDFAGDAAARAQHGLDQDGGQLAPVRRHALEHVGQVVVARHDPLVWHVDRRAAAGKGQHAAVVAALEHQHLAPPGVCAGRGQRHQVGLGARVGEAQQLHGRKAPLHLARQRTFARGVRRQAEAVFQRLGDGGADGGLGMAVQPRGELAQRVEVAVAVGVPQPAAFAAHHGGRKRREEQHAARVAAGQHQRGVVEDVLAGRASVAVAVDGLGQGLVEIAHDLMAVNAGGMATPQRG